MLRCLFSALVSFTVAEWCRDVVIQFRHVTRHIKDDSGHRQFRLLL